MYSSQFRSLLLHYFESRAERIYIQSSQSGGSGFTAMPVQVEPSATYPVSIRRLNLLTRNVVTVAFSNTRSDVVLPIRFPTDIAAFSNGGGVAAYIIDASTNRVLVAYLDRTASAVCSAGVHCPAGSSAATDICPAGMFCAEATAPTPCLPGRYCTSGSPSSFGNLFGSISFVLQLPHFD